MLYLRPSAAEEINKYLNKRVVLFFFFFLSLNSTDDLCLLQSWEAPSGGPPLPNKQGLTGSGQEGSNVRRQVKGVHVTELKNMDWGVPQTSVQSLPLTLGNRQLLTGNIIVH